MSYDSWKLATPPEYDACACGAYSERECSCELYPEDEVTAIDDSDAVAYFDAADGGEENDNMEPELTQEHFTKAVKSMSPLSLVSMRNAIDAELKTRREALRKELEATEHALAGTKPRATRSDAGRPRAARESAPRIRDNSESLEAERKRATS